MRKDWKNQDSPEWTRFCWAVIFCALCCLFACDRYTEQTIADYWFLWLLPLGLLWWLQSRCPTGLKKKLLGFLAFLLFGVFALPYVLMLGVWLIFQLMP